MVSAQRPRDEAAKDAAVAALLAAGIAPTVLAVTCAAGTAVVGLLPEVDAAAAAVAMP